MEKFTLELIVSNTCSILSRVTGIYAKRGYKIDSMWMAESEDSGNSRVVITSRGDEYVRNQMLRQLSKLYDVRRVAINQTI